MSYSRLTRTINNLSLALRKSPLQLSSSAVLALHITLFFASVFVLGDTRYSPPSNKTIHNAVTKIFTRASSQTPPTPAGLTSPHLNSACKGPNITGCHNLLKHRNCSGILLLIWITLLNSTHRNVKG